MSCSPASGCGPLIWTTERVLFPDFQKGIGVHGKEIMGDIPNYTDIAPQIQVSEIVVS